MNSSSRAKDGRRFQVKDFLRADGVTVDSPDDRLTMEDTLLAGDFYHKELRDGLFLHLSDVREERAFTAVSTLKEELSCIFFLDGDVEVAIGDRTFAFHGSRQRIIEGAAIMNSAPETFRRSSGGDQHLRHLVVSASPEWLNLDGLTHLRDERRASTLLKDHLADHRWSLTPRLADLVRQLFVPTPLMPELRDLYLECRAVEIVVETISAVMRAERRTDGPQLLARHDAARLQRAKDIIAVNLMQPRSVDMVAREAGTSASGLQRLFRLSEGMGVFAYVRQQRLERAFEALKAHEATIQQASIIAGYTNSANFTTAFKRHFGKTPRSIFCE